MFFLVIFVVMKFFEGKNITFAWIGLLLISWMLINNSFFLHWHKLDDGTYVIHAHPHDKEAEDNSKGAGHNHNCKELVFINFVNSVLVLVTLLAGLSFFSPQILRKLCNYTTNSFLEIFLEIIKPRPPPLFLKKY